MSSVRQASREWRVTPAASPRVRTGMGGGPAWIKQLRAPRAGWPRSVARLKPLAVWGNLRSDDGNDGQRAESPGHAAGVRGFTAFAVRIHGLQYQLLFPRRRPRSGAHGSATPPSREGFCQAWWQYALPRRGGRGRGWGAFGCVSESPRSLSPREMPSAGSGGSPCSRPGQVCRSDSGNRHRTICRRCRCNTGPGLASHFASFSREIVASLCRFGNPPHLDPRPPPARVVALFS